jgi:hypothetical protein
LDNAYIFSIGSEYEKKAKEPKKKNIQPEVPVFTKKENAMLRQRIKILDWYHVNGKNQTSTARHFAPIYPNLKIKQPLVSSWVKKEEYWREQWEKVQHASGQTTKRARQTEHPDISHSHRRSPASEMDTLCKSGWDSRFKERNGLRQVKRHGEAASANMETVERERERVQNLIKESGYALRDIFNMDETGLFYGCVPLPIFA